MLANLVLAMCGTSPRQSSGMSVFTRFGHSSPRWSACTSLRRRHGCAAVARGGGGIRARAAARRERQRRRRTTAHRLRASAATPPDSPVYGEALYWRAALAATSTDAERDYRRLIVEYPLSSHVGDALYALAQLESARGDRAASATTHLEQFLADNPRRPDRPRGDAAPRAACSSSRINCRAAARRCGRRSARSPSRSSKRAISSSSICRAASANDVTTGRRRRRWVADTPARGSRRFDACRKRADGVAEGALHAAGRGVQDER